MCVRITKRDLIKVKRAIPFITNGTQLILVIPTKIAVKSNVNVPYTKIPPTSYALMLLSIRSVTGASGKLLKYPLTKNCTTRLVAKRTIPPKKDNRKFLSAK